MHAASIYSTRTLLLTGFGLCALAAAGCEKPPGIAPARRRVEGALLRGHVVLGREARVFEPCGQDAELWVTPSEELRALYHALSPAPHAPVFVELRGTLGPPPDTGIDNEYAGRLRVLEVRRAAPANEGPGCAEDLTGIAFRAAGEEPFWQLRVTDRAIVFSAPGTPDLSLPGAFPQRSPRGWVYRSEAANRSIRLSVERGHCMSTMVGSRYSWRARAEIDGQLYEGCAWEGEEAPVP